MPPKPKSERERAIDGFLAEAVEAWINGEAGDGGHAISLLRNVEEYQGMTDEEFKKKYLKEN